MRIIYDSKSEDFKKPFGALREDEHCTVSILLPAELRTKEIYIKIEDEGDFSCKIPLDFACNCGPYDKYSADFSLCKAGLYFYHFYIITETTKFSLFKYGEHDTNMEAGELWQLTCYPKDFHVCSDFTGKVIYQIFPDRFYKAGEVDLTDKLTPYWIHENTLDTPEYRPDEHGEILNCDFFGGNLRGIAEKLPYLKSLGVDIVYLNPS